MYGLPSDSHTPVIFPETTVWAASPKEMVKILIISISFFMINILSEGINNLKYSDLRTMLELVISMV
jgi:hypothetical protein